MSLAEDYQERLRRQTELELSPEGLRRFASLPQARRANDDVVRALLWAAELIEQQSKLIGQMRVAHQPYAMAAPSFSGHDSDVIVDGNGHQLRLGHLRASRKMWSTRAPITAPS